MARSPRASRPFIDRLESRIALSTVSLSGGTLTITGTPKADSILIGRVNAQRVNLKLDGKDMGGFGPVSRILVDADAGKDTVLVGPKVTLPAIIQGGRGADTLQGGSGPDQVFGDDGDDILTGTKGRDALDGGQGSNRVTTPKGMGTIYVGPTASGDALRILSKAYTLQRSKSVTGPMVVGKADLNDANTVNRLRRSYEAGETVSLTKATVGDAALLSGLVGHEGAIDWDSSLPRAELVSLRKSIRADGGTNFSTNIVMPRQHAPVQPGRGMTNGKTADRFAVEKLSQTFAALPVEPDSPPGDSGSMDIVSLSTSYQSKSLGSDTVGDAIQVINSVWSARSFKNQSDFYYVLQEFDVEYGGYYTLTNWLNNITSQPVPQGTSIIQPSPSSSMEATSETTSVSYTIGSDVGWNQMQGLNASISGSVTVDHSKTTVIPAVKINNSADFPTATANWSYQVNDLPTSPESIDFLNSWIWEVPFGSYKTLNAFPYSVNGNLIFGPPEDPVLNLIFPQINVSIPFPFGSTFTLQSPAITGIVGTDEFLGEPTVAVGQTLTIQGSGFYPSLVTGVLIGGAKIPQANITKITNTEITIDTPDISSFETQTVVVETTQGVSNSNFTVLIY